MRASLGEALGGVSGVPKDTTQPEPTGPLRKEEVTPGAHSSLCERQSGFGSWPAHRPPLFLLEPRSNASSGPGLYSEEPGVRERPVGKQELDTGPRSPAPARLRDTRGAHLGVVDTGAGPTTILTGCNESLMKLLTYAQYLGAIHSRAPTH